MSERAYTVSEIDSMRSIVGAMVRMRCGYTERDESLVVEDRLRTYMLANVTPEALEAEYQRLQREAKEQRAAYELLMAERRLRAEYGPRP